MSFVPENKLEEAMLQAASHAPSRPLFYRLLMETELYVLGVASGSSGAGPLTGGEMINIDSITRDGKSYHPVFTSQTRMNAFVPEPQSHFLLRGRALFESTRGASFVLNPNSDLGKTLVPDEIAYWLAHSRQSADQTDIVVGQPDIYPKKLVKALCVLFMSRSRIAAAHLAYAAPAGSHEAAYPLIGLEADSDVPTLAQEIFQVAATTLPGARIDVVYLDPNAPGTPLQQHLLSIAPFYRRAPEIPHN
ncbi:MAG: enhanced serine sensitivity protein SseB C-terminal domain-containing protein [Alphaproteobacteria bacterium]|nr:enhanced serine sensitivity protein SseB C-terminal domain-containing protein [Alphaproteobacteria bacterium]